VHFAPGQRWKAFLAALFLNPPAGANIALGVSDSPAFFYFLENPMTQNSALDALSEPYGRIAMCCGFHLPLKVMKSNAGYYIGTMTVDSVPVSRESLESWTTAEKAQKALNSDDWTQRV
jgi:hypothetical protein